VLDIDGNQLFPRNISEEFNESIELEFMVFELSFNYS
jgi:hypothetical protein